MIFPLIGGGLMLLGVGLLGASFFTRSSSPGSESISTPSPATVIALAGPGAAPAPSPAAADRALQATGGPRFAVPPPELTSPGWVQNFRVTRLWAGASGGSADLGEVPQFTFLQFDGQSQDGRARVLDPGDGARRPPREGWINAEDIGPSGAPTVEWFAGVAPSERGLAGLPRRVSEEWPAAISGQGAIVMDAQSGAVLFGKNARRRVAMASLTKMVTAIVAIEQGRLDDRITTDIDSLKMAIEMESTVMGLKPGDVVTLETLLYGLMLPSGNDAAVAIAKHISGSESRFVDQMNAKVRELGLEDTQFKNPHGLDAAGHFSTPYDQAVIARYGFTNPTFTRLAAAKEYSGDGFQLWNTNRLLWNYPGADGVKPGFTDDAGSALAASATRDGRRVITVVIKANSAAIDCSPLLDWAFKTFRS